MRKSMQNGIEIFSSFLKENKRTVLVLLGVFIFGDILFVNISSDFIIFSVLLLYVIFIKIFKIQSGTTFLVCAVLLTIMAVSYLSSFASIRTEKAAVWFILFLVVGAIQGWKE